MVTLFVVFGPALASIIVFFGRDRYSRDKMSRLPVIAVGFSLFWTSILFYLLLRGFVGDGGTEVIGTWFSIATFQVNINFLLDPLSIVMLFVITSYHF